MKVKFKKTLPVFLSVSVFSGCAFIDKTVDTVMTPVDSAGHGISKTYEKSTSYVKKISNNTSNYLTKVKHSAKDNSFGRLFYDDSDIQKSRENLIKWEVSNKRFNFDKNTKDINTIFKKLSLSAQNRYLEKFNKKHPKPKFDEFLSDRENINIFNEYNLKLLKVKNYWNETLETRKVKILSDSLNALYGNPVLSYKSYDNYEKELFLEISSKDKSFNTLIVSIEVDNKDEARYIKNNIRKMSPAVYFKTSSDNSLSVDSVTVFKDRSKKEFYFANLENEAFKREDNFIAIHSNGKMQSTYADVNLQKEIKNLKNKPKWFGKRVDADYYYGFGYGLTRDIAMAEAKKELAHQKGITLISSSSSIEKRVDSDDNIDKTFIQSAKQTLDNVRLAGIEPYNEEIVDSIYYYSYRLKK